MSAGSRGFSAPFAAAPLAGSGDGYRSRQPSTPLRRRSCSRSVPRASLRSRDGEPRARAHSSHSPGRTDGPARRPPPSRAACTGTPKPGDRAVTGARLWRLRHEGNPWERRPVRGGDRDLRVRSVEGRRPRRNHTGEGQWPASQNRVLPGSAMDSRMLPATWRSLRSRRRSSSYGGQAARDDQDNMISRRPGSRPSAARRERDGMRAARPAG
jgi:hypothetical protein